MFNNQKSSRDQPHLSLLESTTVKPIFIIGVARSGTSLLHHLLSETGAFNYVSAYHVFKYEELLDNTINLREAAARQEVNELIQSYGMKDRGIDSIRMSADTPEEYGMILAKLCRRYLVDSATLPFAQQILKKVQYTSGSPEKPLLLKNPADIFDLPFIRAQFPDAKFVLLLRHPIHIANSLIKFYISLTLEVNPYFRDVWPFYRLLSSNPILFKLAKVLLASTFLNSRLRMASLAVSIAQASLLKNVTLMSAPNVVSIRYEDLCQDPNRMMDCVLKSLEVTPTQTIDFRQRISPRPVKLLPDVEENYHRLAQRFKPLIDYAGYSLPSLVRYSSSNE